MKKAVIIIGGVSILGLGWYLYSKMNKKTPILPSSATTGGLGNNLTQSTGGETATNNGNTPANTSTPPTGTQLATVEQVQQVVAQNAMANALAIQIFNLRTAIVSSATSGSGFNLGFNNVSMQNAMKSAQIKQLEAKLAEMGFREQNGAAIKI